jgi:GR25 family glycosyltransferase involved in LPS biosynthesis
MDAVDGALVEANLLASLVDQGDALKNRGRRLGHSEVACAESHRKLYRWLGQSHYAGCVILEDDVEFDDALVRFVGQLGECQHCLAERKMIIYLGGREGFENRLIAFARRKPSFPILDFELKRVIRSESGVQRTCGYYITRAAAKNILSSEEKIVHVADAWDFRLKRRTLDEIWMPDPPLVRHPVGSLPSLLEAERLKLEESANRLIDRYASLQPLSRSWRMMKHAGRKYVYYPLLTMLN